MAAVQLTSTQLLPFIPTLTIRSRPRTQPSSQTHPPTPQVRSNLAASGLILAPVSFPFVNCRTSTPAGQLVPTTRQQRLQPTNLKYHAFKTRIPRYILAEAIDHHKTATLVQSRCFSDTRLWNSISVMYEREPSFTKTSDDREVSAKIRKIAGVRKLHLGKEQLTQLLYQYDIRGEEEKGLVGTHNGKVPICDEPEVLGYVMYYDSRREWRAQSRVKLN